MKESSDDGKTKRSTRGETTCVGCPRITWLRRILYRGRRGQRGARAPLFGLCRPLALVAWGHNILLAWPL
jgi:hypothetical protein